MANGVAPIDSTAVRTAEAVTGNKGDTAVQAVGTDKSNAAYIKGIVNALMGTAGITSWPAGAAPNNGVSIAEAIRYISENIAADKVGTPVNTGGTATVGAVLGDVANSSIATRLGLLASVLSGTDGIASFPAAAAAANGVSMAEVLRYVSEKQGFRVVSKVAATGSQGAVDLFTVTGVCELNVIGHCTDGVASSGTPTLEVGVAGSTASILAQIVDATNLDTDEVYGGATPGKVQALPTAKVVNAATIIQTIGSADATGGSITYYCIWRPLSTNGAVAAA